MKKTLMIATALAAMSISTANARPLTAHELKCMANYGFTEAEWRAKTVPASKANPYRVCRDAAKASGQ
jgi:hypothetical protein